MKKSPLELVIEARENRWMSRKQSGQAFVTFSLNVPGYPKTSPLIEKAFLATSKEALRFLSTFQQVKNPGFGLDEAGHFLFLPLGGMGLKALTELKEKCACFERNHQAGRLLDLDVYDESGIPISGNRRRQCLLCDRSAILCMMERSHATADLRQSCEELLAEYLRKLENRKMIDRLTEFAVSALLTEASVHPKPGLVTRISSGSHKDMDFFTYLSSTSALAPGYLRIAEAALAGEWPENLHLSVIRCLGMTMEDNMFSATSGINTQKGAIFLMGIAVYASALSFRETRRLDHKNIRSLIGKICRGLTAELESPGATHGQMAHEKFGITGARGEVEAGFPLVFKEALPILSVCRNRGFDQDTACRLTLSAIIAENDDTNLYFRGGLKKALAVKKLAAAVVALFRKKATLKQLGRAFERLCDYCGKNNLSCGGSADLLAVSLFFESISELQNHR
ncbi:MAG: triphosphoribosyl-dephospho-CoA synthase [Candidatus Wallbacteria bacterium]|nr:triphosphoribosyl-dephospho-CoA synthase [Candidatus Wallbacteria bacterium]